MAIDKAVDSSQLDAGLLSVANAIRTKGGTSAQLAFPADFISAIAAIPSGGGGGIPIGIQSTPIANILNMFYSLENSTAKTGEFTLAQAIGTSEEKVVETGLSSVHGFFVADEDQSSYISANTPENTLISIGFFDGSGNGLYAVTRYTMQTASIGSSSGASRTFLNRCTWRWDGGDLYLSGSYNHNDNYTPFHSGHKYRWVAW